MDIFTVAVTVLLLPFQAQDFSPRLPGCLLCRLGRLAPQYLGRDIFELVLQFLQRQRRVLRLLPLIAQRFTVTQGTCNDGILAPSVRRLHSSSMLISAVVWGKDGSTVEAFTKILIRAVSNCVLHRIRTVLKSIKQP